jgi:hypothetical protein
MNKETVNHFREILEHCAKDNPRQFNINKALEESLEFTEAMLKYETKHPDNPKRPTLNDVVDEYGDFIYRGMILLMTLFPESNIERIQLAVDARINDKLEKLQEWKYSGMYKGEL